MKDTYTEFRNYFIVNGEIDCVNIESKIKTFSATPEFKSLLAKGLIIMYIDRLIKEIESYEKR